MSPGRLLWRWLSPHWARIGLAALLATATVAAGVGLMGCAAFVIASAALHPPLGALQVAIVGVRFFGLARAGLRYLERLVSHSLTLRLLQRLRVWLFTRLEPLAPAGLQRAHSGDLLARVIADVETLEGVVARGVTPVLASAAVLLVLSTALASVHFSLGLAYMACALLATVALPSLLLLTARGSGARERRLIAEQYRALVDVAQGAQDLLAADQGAGLLAHSEQIETRLERLRARLARLTALDPALGGLLSHVTVVLLLVLAIPLLRQEIIGGVALTVLVLVAQASFEAYAGLAKTGLQLGSQVAAADRLAALLGQQPAVTDPECPQALPDTPAASDEPLLSIEGLRFAYPGSERLALDGVDLQLLPGRSVVLVGPSGAGKSTLLNLLLRFWDGYTGSIALCGVELRGLRQSDVRGAMGVVSQRTDLFAGTLRDNLLLARPDADQEQLDAAVDAAQLQADILDLPQGLDTWIGEHGAALSAGQRQRLALARALLRTPRLLLLDEPTAHLDPVSADRVWRSLMATATCSGTLVITHQLRNMERYDEILVLQRGRVVARGKHAQLLEHRGPYRAMWELQRAEFAKPPGKMYR